MADKEEKPDINGLNPDDLRNLLRENSVHKTNATHITDKIKTANDEFVEATGINKKALGWGQQLHKLKPENRADVIRSFGKIVDLMGPVWNQAEDDMFDKDEAKQKELEDA